MNYKQRSATIEFSSQEKPLGSGQKVWTMAPPPVGILTIYSCLWFVPTRAAHPQLANSPWPACHGDAGATDTSLAAGPSGEAELESQLITHHAIFSLTNTYLPISIVFGGEQLAWGTSVSSVLLLQEDEQNPEQWRLADTYYNGGFDFSYHGGHFPKINIVPV